MRSVFSRFSWLFALLRRAAAAVSFVAAADRRAAACAGDVTPRRGRNIPSLKPMEVIDRPLLAKGIVLDDGRRRYILCAIDWCEICNSTYALFCRKIAKGAGTDPRGSRCMRTTSRPHPWPTSTPSGCSRGPRAHPRCPT